MDRSPNRLGGWAVAAVMALVPTSSLLAQASHSQMVERGIGFLRQRQLDDGSFSPEAGTGITSLALTALLRNGVSADEPVIQRGLDYLRKHTHPNGGIHVADSKHRNYETCLAVMCMIEANQDGKFDEQLKKSEAFLKSIQWTSIESSDTAYGGAGYGSHQRPDLSNTSFLIETLHALGNDADSEALQQALTFVSRCQNLKSEHNQSEFADKINDGGFYYTIAAGGTSQAGVDANGGLRSYASMTYSGLKSMLFAGVDANDPRVKAAVDWISKHYRLDENPGMGAAGLYYYYHIFAKALDAMKVDTLVDDAGTQHDWRKDLNATLAGSQQPNGSWVNTQHQRWLEGNPDLVTGYALLALSYTAPQQ